MTAILSDVVVQLLLIVVSKDNDRNLLAMRDMNISHKLKKV